MDKQELKQAFDNLDLNQKRNAYNEEILKLFELFRDYCNMESTISNLPLYNYNIYNDEFLEEDEVLSKEYLNILYLRELILTTLIKKDF